KVMPSDPTLVAASVIGFSAPSSTPLNSFVRSATIAIQLEFSERHFRDDTWYRLEPVRSGVLHLELLAMKTGWSLLLGNWLAPGRVDSITLTRRPQKRHGLWPTLELSFDYVVSRDSVMCDEVRVQSLEWLLNAQP